MSLSSLLIRTLLCLLLVSTATAELTCWQQVPPVLIRDLWNQSRLLINDLPTENSSVQHRFLPNFCTKCPELVIGWSDMKALIDVYQRSVFKRSAVQKLLPLHYPEMMHRLQHTLQRCGLTKASIGSNPLFSSVMRSINTSCQRGENLQLMNATLDVYTRIFSSILQNQQQQHRGAGTGTGTGTGASALLDQLPDGRRSEVEEALMKLQQKMENLKNHMNPRNHNRDDVLNKLNKIRVDDPTVQKKALAEFTEVFQTASVIGSRMC